MLYRYKSVMSWQKQPLCISYYRRNCLFSWYFLWRRFKIFLVWIMILEDFNLNNQNSTCDEQHSSFTLLDHHSIFNVTGFILIPELCPRENSMLQPKAAIIHITNAYFNPQEWFHRVHHHYKMKTDKQSITQIPVNNSVETISYVVSK